MNDAIMEALNRKKGKGMEIKIIVEGPEGQEMKAEGANDKSSDLAPDGGEMPQEDNPMEAEMEGALMGGMSDYDKENLMQRDPRSLAEAARKAAMERKAK